MIGSVLIANRGEIAVRIMRTASRLGIRTVAVFSEADATAPHVQAADDAVCIGPAPAGESYLRMDHILEAAVTTGARAVHPGYGFLSENDEFARACADAGVIFVGPPAEAIRIMGSKAESKTVMAAAGVPLVPGHHGDQHDQRLVNAAAQIGYPVLVKASAGGGGKGMRIVSSPDELPAAIASARREARGAFGDDELLLEKYLVNPRHIEIQVFADTHGNFVHLNERDCSVQRRHQKIVEEAPAAQIGDDLRAAMGATAIAAARAVNYVGAGTVEFLLHENTYYFIEMNTRLQVEHPVTELVTGTDLVEWQFRVASGEALPLSQPEIALSGHAIETRIYAEDPASGFLPATGTISYLSPPLESRHVRIDAGYSEGDAVGVHYDPMIAKLIVWDTSRVAAVARLASALEQYQIAGLATNISFLSRVVAHPEFKAGGVGTGFLDDHAATLPGTETAVPDVALALAGIAILNRGPAGALASARDGCRTLSSESSPWNLRSGWRLNDDNHHRLVFFQGHVSRLVTLHFRQDGYEVEIGDGAAMSARQVADDGRTVTAVLAGRRHEAVVVGDVDHLTVLAGSSSWRLGLDNPMIRAEQQQAGSGRLTAPMPGTVVSVAVSPGESVSAGQTLIVLEAMKMEHVIRAPANGTVADVSCASGEQVTDGAGLITIDLDDTAVETTPAR